MSENQSIHFQARWHESIITLKKRKVVFIPFLRKICRRKILPSSCYSRIESRAIEDVFEQNWYKKESIQNPLKDFYAPTPLKLITPDGIFLSGTYFRNRLHPRTCPTVLLFQPNASLAKHGVYDWLLEMATEKNYPVNFITFDYRGCGTSKGKALDSRKLILDGDTAYQFIRDYLNVPENLIHFYGYSLGGGVGAEVKKLYPEHQGKYVNERSFSSMKEAIRSVYPKMGKFLAWLSEKAHWTFNASAAWNVMQGEKLIVHQPQDEIIPEKASLLYGISNREHNHILFLQKKKDIEDIKFHHSAPLSCYVDKASNLLAHKKVWDFLFSS